MAIVWNFKLERSAHIFIAKILPSILIILKINHILLLWLTASSKAKRMKLNDFIVAMKCNLKFLGSRAKGGSDNHKVTTNPSAKCSVENLSYIRDHTIYTPRDLKLSLSSSVLFHY